jgi:hypothetical protein
MRTENIYPQLPFRQGQANMNWIDQCNNNFVSKKLQAFSLAASQTAKETQPNRVHVGVENLSKIWPEAVNITPCYAECCCQH